ncbi:hypothetical protein RFI_19661 [Reticulomyxa filosa]|uniref:Uncharacterized protein n=1 Tax=Reticulomyxa filosa TaxID=46433 RepID=X6MX43_RETFI|nr:hypothetical protein RFI_19661 [Reticulomyxa filosa]|eukprot:ETO17660.1 hypothetical protein RFI_19661 [Reticulomyxa filosa]
MSIETLKENSFFFLKKKKKKLNTELELPSSIFILSSMQGYTEKVRELWDHNTTFANLWFNVLSSFCYYHEHITAQYLWWPILESIRLFLLTLARVDVILKEPQYLASVASNDSNSSNTNEADNRNNEARGEGEQTRRLIVACNVSGVVNLGIGLPLFLLMLNRDKQNPLYTTSLTIFPLFLLLRIILSVPMIVAVIWKTPFYRSYNGNNYERIIDSTLTTHHSPVDKQSYYRNIFCHFSVFVCVCVLLSCLLFTAVYHIWNTGPLSSIREIPANLPLRGYVLPYS